MTKLFLIRHGETDWNLEGRYQGQSDIPLNANGLLQAEKLAEKLRTQHLDAIYSSDLMRARRTAEILGQATGAPLHIDLRLREINQGEWEGMLFSEIRQRYPELISQRRSDPLSVTPPGGESIEQVRERVLAALDAIVSAHPDGEVAIVSHGLALAIIKVHLSDLPISSVWDQIPENAQPELVSTEVL